MEQKEKKNDTLVYIELRRVLTHKLFPPKYDLTVPVLVAGN